MHYIPSLVAKRVHTLVNMQQTVHLKLTYVNVTLIKLIKVSEQQQKKQAVPKRAGAAGEARGAHLLQRGRAQLDGDVLELPVPLGAEVADHIWVLVRLSQQLDLTVRETEALGEDPLDGHVAAVKHAPARRRGEGGLRTCPASTGPRGSFHRRSGCLCSLVAHSVPTHRPEAPRPPLPSRGELFCLVTVMTPSAPGANGSSHMRPWASVALQTTHRYTIVPSAPWPRTSFGQKEIFPTITMLVSSSGSKQGKEQM